MDVESVTSLVISPTVYFDNQLVPTTAGLITLAGGRQPVRLPVTLPATAQSSGLLTVVFNTVDGVPVGGLTTALQVGGVELTALTLEGANRSAPVNARLDVFGNGPATLVLTPDVGQPVTTTVQLSGYQSLTIPYVLPPGARTLTALLREPRGCAASRTLVINQALPDTEAPSVALGTIAAPAGTATVAPIFVSGTAQDGGSGLCALTINGQTPSFDPRTGAYSMTIQFPPGNHVITATAFDCDGNRSDSPPQAISIARVFPAAQFANAALTASESAPALRVGVTLDQASSITGTVRYATDGGSATAGADYVATSGTLVFAPLQTTAWLTVTLRGDSLDEASETIQLQLANPVNASLGLTATTTLTLLDDDALPALAPASPPPVSEAAGTATLTVTLSAPSGQLVRVAYATVDGTARAGADYAQTNGILTFPAGTTTQTIRVPLFRDVLAEADELFRVDLSAPSNATLSSASSTVTITDEVLTNTGLWLPFVIR